MHWFILLIRNGLLGAALLFLSQALVPVLYLWAALPLLLGLLATLYQTAHTLWLTRPNFPGWCMVGVCWGVFIVAAGIYFGVGHLRRGHPLVELLDAEPALPAFFAGGGIVSLVVVAAVWWQQSALKQSTK